MIAKLSLLCVYTNFSHFYLGIFLFENFLSVQESIETQKIVYYCLVITLWKCEYCLTWALNNSRLFGCNSQKVPDMNSEKSFYYSLIWKDFSENVSIVWCLEKCVVLFGSNSQKVSVMFDMNSENVFTLV